VLDKVLGAFEAAIAAVVVEQQHSLARCDFASQDIPACNSKVGTLDRALVGLAAGCDDHDIGLLGQHRSLVGRHGWSQVNAPLAALADEPIGDAAKSTAPAKLGGHADLPAEFGLGFK
jgi:hypothetical protein